MPLSSRRSLTLAVIALAAAIAGCSNHGSPTEPTALPATIEILTGQTLTVPGTDLTFTFAEAEPPRCPPNANCLAGAPGLRLTARVGRRDPVPVYLVWATDGPGVQQPVDGYLIGVGPLARDANGVWHLTLFLERS
jgi:hypothetical protein